MRGNKVSVTQTYYTPTAVDHETLSRHDIVITDQGLDQLSLLVNRNLSLQSVKIMDFRRAVHLYSKHLP